MRIQVVIHVAEEGGYWANVPALPGCVSEGDTVDAMLSNIREAIECYVDAPCPVLDIEASIKETAE